MDISIERLKEFLTDEQHGKLDLDTITIPDESEDGVLFHIMFLPSVNLGPNFCKLLKLQCEGLDRSAGGLPKYRVHCNIYIDRDCKARIRLQFND